VNLSLFEEVSYTREQELLAISRIAEQKLSFEVHSLKLQLNYEAQTREAISGYWKGKVRTHFLVKIQLSVETDHPGQCIHSKHVVDTIFHWIG
jgi:hypothetical protein